MTITFISGTLDLFVHIFFCLHIYGLIVLFFRRYSNNSYNKVLSHMLKSYHPIHSHAN